jgi:hypothetical protein
LLSQSLAKSCLTFPEALLELLACFWIVTKCSFQGCAEQADEMYNTSIAYNYRLSLLLAPDDRCFTDNFASNQVPKRDFGELVVHDDAASQEYIEVLVALVAHVIGHYAITLSKEGIGRMPAGQGHKWHWRLAEAWAVMQALCQWRKTVLL